MGTKGTVHTRVPRQGAVDTEQRRGRALGVLDVENQVWRGPRGASEADFEYTAHRFIGSAGLQRGDHLIIGSAPNAGRVFGAAAAWPGALLRTRRGIDGADEVLCEELEDVCAIARRFDKVVVGSGDHCFIEPVIRLNEAGVHTVVVSWPHSLNRELR